MEYESSRVKRRRSASITSSSSSSSSSSPSPSRSPSPAPVPKYHRTDHSLTPTDTPFTCNLPPTCSQPHTITSYATEEELLRHQETFHRWVCRTPIKDRSQPTPPDGVPTRFVSGNPDGKGWKECGKVFPDERLLHLHQTETHDPIAQTRQARGEKIFECFVPPPGCVKTFANPARRRRHLIDKHRYPEQYFFAITNHGINRLAEEDGLAISLIRPKKDHRDFVSPAQSSGAVSSASVKGMSGGGGSDVCHASESKGSARSGGHSTPSTPADVEMDGLVSSMESSLQFVPKGVRKKQASRT